MPSDFPKVVIVYEKARESWARNLGTFTMIVGLWSLGWFAGSPALEWVGAILGLIMTFIIAHARLTDTKRHKTPAEARAWLDEHFPES